ncbi:hypothetical protein GCM10011352_42040 [Marinobacterium zhoushanense]|uniref:TTHB210-like domain-containing protein n=1 Tax=Marinobacterium zhoushanense TaxID=1679163 RepID=A0ABQ1KZD8_9GAMM|nr:DUF5602 domain-containing protein [Marinobacterium zhoushanense]GGC11146.1 hypothetical protein GCM10011352_42040 [Marinobacterium zhoushanense]
MLQIPEMRVVTLNTLILSGLAMSIVGCSQLQQEQSQAGTYEGPPVVVGMGEARTFATLDEQGEVATLGILMSEGALEGLPEQVPHGELEFHLALPPQARDSGYDHVSLGWNPQGHIPSGVYDVPHFDFHFYLIDEGARGAITATGEDLARAHKQPETSHMPVDYVLPEGTEVPNMGAHAIDPGSDEFNGKPFTHTFIYGFYDGEIIFMEPMMTMTFLQSRPNISTPVKQPQAYVSHFAYPAFYGVYFDAGNKEYRITLDGLSMH